MDDKRRFRVIITSVAIGTILSAGLLKLRYGKLDSTLQYSIVFYFVMALVFLFLMSRWIKNNKDNEKYKK